MENIRKKIILDELIEGSHPVKVENVIFWALQNYPDFKDYSSAVSYSVTERIKEAEKEGKVDLMNPEIVEEILKY